MPDGSVDKTLNQVKLKITDVYSCHALIICDVLCRLSLAIKMREFQDVTTTLNERIHCIEGLEEIKTIFIKCSRGKLKFGQRSGMHSK